MAIITFPIFLKFFAELPDIFPAITGKGRENRIPVKGQKSDKKNGKMDKNEKAVEERTAAFSFFRQKKNRFLLEKTAKAIYNGVIKHNRIQNEGRKTV